LCGYSCERLKGVHPVLMGNEVTQLPGIPPHLAAGMLVAKSTLSLLGEFLPGSTFCPPSSRTQHPSCNSKQTVSVSVASAAVLRMVVTWELYSCCVLPSAILTQQGWAWPEHWNFEKVPR
jgi:hypothetical protein